MVNDDFFESCKEQSHIKSQIVKKYFWAWAKIISKRALRISYIDLYAGPGVYEDGTKSTPILVLENALRDDMMRTKLIAHFNDTDSKFAETLKNSIDKIPNIDLLTNKPRITNFSVGKEVVESLRTMTLIPTFMFIDPWGYKGLSIDLIGSVLKNWGCDCVFFFNYVRINAGIDNEKFKSHINAIFGETRASFLKKETHCKKPHEREEIILRELKNALKEIRGDYVITYRFLKKHPRKTSHYLIFVSKNPLGYEIMKGIMAELSSHKYQNVATFEFDPEINPYGLFPPSPLDDLKKDLLTTFKSKTLTVQEIYEKHNINTPYIKSNYKELLLELEKKKIIIADPPAEKRKLYQGKLTLGDNVKITFL